MLHSWMLGFKQVIAEVDLDLVWRLVAERVDCFPRISLLVLVVRALLELDFRVHINSHL